VDYKASPLSERLANNVARAVDHHLEWTHVYYLEGDPSRLLGATELKDFRLHLFSTCRELQMMWDISDAAHHRILTRRSIPPRRMVNTSTAAYFTKAEELWVNGYDKPFLASALNAVGFWRRWSD
jgi:hypothetical protein